MTFAAPAALALAALAVPIILLHVLRPQRVQHEVSSTFLWRTLERPVSSARPWQRLRLSALLIAQVLVMLLLAAAAARPVVQSETELFEHTVFLIDTSGSMAALDGTPDRRAEAIERARAQRGELPAGGEASLIEVSSEPRVLLTRSADPEAFNEAIKRLADPGGAADFAAAFSLAASLETADASIGYVLFSDGHLSEVETSLLLPDTRYERVGQHATNRAITRLSVQPRGSALHVRATVANTGGPDATQTLRIDVDGRTVSTQQLSIPSGASVEHAAEVPAGDRIQAILDGEDLLAADDHAYAVATRRRNLSVLVVGGDNNVFLTELLAATGDTEVERAADGAVTADGHDLVIYDRVAVPDDPGAPFLAIAPPAGIPGNVEVLGAVDLPAITLVHGDDPLLAGVDLTNVVIAAAQTVDAPIASVLVGAEQTPLLLRGAHAGHPFAYLSFALADSTLPLDVAYPILFDRLLAELSGVALPPASLQVGDVLPVDATRAVTIDVPGQTSLSVAPGDSAPRATRPGFWTITADGRPPLVVAVNAHQNESALVPAPSLPTEARVETLEGEPAQTETSLLKWFALALLVLIAVELLLAWRVVGVSRRQWRVAVLLRALVSLALVAVLLDLAVVRRDDRVATVFLVDASDSLGQPGRADAVEFVREALREQPEGTVSAIALFGGDARVERTLAARNEFGTPEVRIDAGQTDVAGALRLAAAVLPEDARRRVVLVSDGRATRGDAADEARRLRARGVQVDVHVIEREVGPDAAVAAVELPSRAFDGDEISIDVQVETSIAGPVGVTLTRDGTPVDNKVVDLEVGRNVVRFTDTASGTALQRYQARVTMAGDSIPQNDAGYGAIEIAGTAKVLVVEGMPGDGDVLVAALRSGGIEVDVVSPDRLPALDALAVYAATVLVDVDARSLSAAQVGDLSATVQGMGRGLVTIGGDRSFALGGYLDSELETLLPVVSEITDPKRRRTVAEVLAIDTSGSMGACHCNEGANGIVGGGNSGPMGGVSKTDISRSAAASAINALSRNDEIGVLAFDSEHEWVIPLGQVPSEDVILDGLDQLRPSGGTDISKSLTEAAAALRASSASLKHIILFSDGFTAVDDMQALARQAGSLREEGITVSVIATGEGASSDLAPIAEQGGGRYYPGRDLTEIPQIMMQETIVASRSFVNEGEFLPSVTSSSQVVADLNESPPLFGFVASTPRPVASTLLRIGEEGDPLLATWQAGLGRSTAWTSDASKRWSMAWADWDGYVNFWSRVVKDVLPVGEDAGAVRGRIENGVLHVVVEGVDAWPEGVRAVGRITTPTMQSIEVQLERIDDVTFRAEVPAGEAGTYAVGALVEGAEGTLLGGRALVNQAYAAEYRAGPADAAHLRNISALSGGRGEIAASQAFDSADLLRGRTRVPLAPLLLVLAALVWPVAVALSRLALRGQGVLVATQQLAWVRARVRAVVPALPGRERTTEEPVPERPRIRSSPPASQPVVPPTVGRLLDRKRERASGGDAAGDARDSSEES